MNDRLMLFVPVSWVLIQLQYYSLLNWPMDTLQHVLALFFSVLTIYLLSRTGLAAFSVAVVTLLLAICASGNGFFVIPIGCVMLWQSDRRKLLLGWLSASVLIFLGYFYRYNFHSSQAHADHSVTSSLHHISLLYMLSMLGSSVARYGTYLPAAALGLCFCAIFVMATIDKMYAKNPALYYSMLFLFMTALAVSGLRSDFGIAQSLVSRYRIYSNLLLVLIYLYLAGKWQDRLRAMPIWKTVCVVVMVLAICFNAASMYAGYKLLRLRTELTKEGMRRWEHGEPSITTDPGPPNEDPVIRRQRQFGDYEVNDRALRQAIELNIYTPPAL